MLVLLLLAGLGWRWSYAWQRPSMPASLAVVWIPLPYLLSHAEALSGPRLPLDGVLLCYAALWLRNQQRPHSAEASMSKWYGPLVASAAVKDCLLLHGHYGYAEEFGLEQRLRDVMAVEIADGTAQVQKIVIARERFGRAFVPYGRRPAG